MVPAAGGLSDELLQLLVPTPDFVPDGKDIRRLELKVGLCCHALAASPLPASFAFVAFADWFFAVACSSLQSYQGL